MVDQNELVTPEAGGEIRGMQQGCKPLGSGLEQLVAGRVTEEIVHFLEAIEIETQDRQPAAVPVRLPEAFVEPVVEGNAAGQCRQRSSDKCPIAPLVMSEKPGDHSVSRPVTHRR